MFYYPAMFDLKHLKHLAVFYETLETVETDSKTNYLLWKRFTTILNFVKNTEFPKKIN